MNGPPASAVSASPFSRDQLRSRLGVKGDDYSLLQQLPCRGVQKRSDVSMAAQREQSDTLLKTAGGRRGKPNSTHSREARERARQAGETEAERRTSRQREGTAGRDPPAGGRRRPGYRRHSPRAATIPMGR